MLIAIIYSVFWYLMGCAFLATFVEEPKAPPIRLTQDKRPLLTRLTGIVLVKPRRLEDGRIVY